MVKGVKRILILLICLLVATAAGCSSKKSDSTSSNGNKSAVTEQKTETSNSGGVEKTSDNSSKTNSSQIQATSERKVIKRSKVELETKHFDEAENFIVERTAKDNGYIESSNVQGRGISDEEYAVNRHAEFTLRIPVDKLNTFLKDTEALGVVVNRSDNDEDVTSQYFDTEARVKTLKIQEDRLLNILQKSDKLSDIIDLEKRLSEVRNEIESLTGTLKKYDNLVALATVTITIQEVQTETQPKAKPVTFGAKVVDGFKESVSALYEILKGILLAIVYVLPFALTALILFIPGRILVRRFKKASSTGKEDVKRANNIDSEDNKQRDDNNQE